MRFADLHMHTNFSDGTFTPEELATHARDKGLHALALTDHDTVEGCERMGRACADLGLELINASEVTTELDGQEIHLLGYFLDIHNPRLLENLHRFQAVRQNRIREMTAALRRHGIPLESETVFELAGCKAPGRPHVARAMVKQGFVKSLGVAFDRYLKVGRPAWVPKFRIGAPEAIELVHHAGGLAVMAHPGLNKSDSVIPKLIEAGLDGIECIHSRHSYNDIERYEALAEKHGLVATGGSDCHGLNRGQPLIGSIKLPYSYVDRMKERLSERHKPAAA